jgi:hypothetical protein
MSNKPGNPGQKAANVVSNYIPNYTELFGPLDLCACDDCRSVLSPAAYLVDLLHFLERSTPNSSGKTPYDALMMRRPDLAYLPLTCANTNTTLPYIDLVNEVLESYVAIGHPDPSAAHDTGTATAQELDANPQYTNDAASGPYATLAAAVYPFTLPFNLPLATIRTFLEHLGSSRYALFDALKADTTAATLRVVNAEYLGIGPEEYPILTGVNIDLTPPSPPTPLYAYYGYASNTLGLLTAVPEFLSRTGIAYDDLIQLLETAFINPAYPRGAALDMFLLIPISFSTLMALAQSGFANPDQATLDALQQAGMSLQQLIDWSNANLVALSKLVVLEADDSTCDLSVTKLQHLDGTPLTEVELTRLHRFIRLWRKLDWSIADLDRALTALGATDLTPDAIDRIAQILRLQRGLAVSQLQVLLTLWADIDTHGDDALYTKLFLNKATLQIDSAFVPNASGAVLTDPAATVAAHVPALTAALRVTAADLDAIRTRAGLADDPTSTPPTVAALTLANVSALYRHAALAKALKLHVADLISLMTLFGVDPFAAPDSAEGFVRIVRAVQASGFKVSTLDYLYRHVIVPPAVLAPQASSILTLATTLRDGLAAIAGDNALAPDPTGELTRAKLGVLFDASVADATVTMVNGTAIYVTPLVALPPGLAKTDASNVVIGIDAAKMPALVASKITFDPVAARLRYQGAMTDAEHAALIAASADAAYLAAINALFTQPATFVENTLTGFLDAAAAEQALLRAVPSLDASLQPVMLDANGIPTADPSQATTTAIASKFEYILEGLLPFVRDQLSHAFVKQTASDALKIDSASVRLLLETVLTSQSDPAQPAIADFLALQTTGLTAACFTSPDLAGAPTIVPTAAVDADATGAALPAGTRSVRWTGVLRAPNTGAFTFWVQTTGAVQLWGDDGAHAIALQLDAATNAWVSTPVALKAGQLWTLRLEATQLPPSATVEWSWQSASTPKAIVPSANLFPAALVDVLGAAFTRLQKSALIANTFKLTDKELAYLCEPAEPQDFAGFDPNALPLARDPGNAQQTQQLDLAAPAIVASWLRLAEYVGLRNGLPRGTADLVDVFTAASMDQAIARVADATGWDAMVVSALAGSGVFALSAADFHDDVALRRMQQAVRLVRQLGVSVDQLHAWSTPSADFGALHDVAQDIRKTVHAKYDEATWLSVAKPLSDGLRQAQRDALVAYLLPRIGMTDPDELFDYFLIDVQMASCMETSRIKQALSSVQLFVQRCLLNLEEHDDAPTASVSPSAIDAEQYSWMERYRVWEANRKVFLYPENWIQPELRDDKSPFFRELESALMQNEATPDNVEAAFLDYLTKLDQVARLDICATYWEDADPDTGKPVNILHVFGRTLHTPRTYFYRQWVNCSTWTPWEKLPLDIEGDHLIPIVWNRRLHLIWPAFQPKTEPPTVAAVDPSASIPLPPAKPYWQIKLVWSEFKQGKWQPKQLTGDYLASIRASNYDTGIGQVADYTLQPPASAHVFEAAVDGDALVVRVFVKWGDVTVGDNVLVNPYVSTLGEFRFDGCGGPVSVGYVSTLSLYPEDWPVNAVDAPVAFAAESSLGDGGSFEFQNWKEASYPSANPDALALLAPESQKAKTYLKATPTPYRLAYPHQYLPYDLQAPFFYQDNRRTYFVTPTAGVDTTTVVSTPAHVDPGPLFNIDIPDFAGPVESIGIGGQIGVLQAGVARASVSNISTRALRSAALLNTPQSARWTSAAALNQATWAGGLHDLFRTTDLQFFNHYHPYVSQLITALNRDGVAGLLTVTNQMFADTGSATFQHQYAPAPSVDRPYPREIVDFDSRGAYAVYNWELFFHAPLLIASRLRKNQRFADAMAWLQYIFNPTDDSAGASAPARYWQVLPFKTAVEDNVDEMLLLMSSDASTLTPEQAEEKKSLQAQFDGLNVDPFQPHLIARLRITPYQKYVVMAYIENLIAWGDQLFRQDTIEAINEATQLYVLASELLGPRPARLPSRGAIAAESYADIRQRVQTLDLPDPIVAIEDAFPFSTSSGGGPSKTGGLMGVGEALYFCVPQNDQLLGYWDTVADRLFKIRNCMNIEGVVRALALFEPPIDPALLVQAAAKGVDLNSVLSDLSAPLPYYRFGFVLQKAMEMCTEVRSLGSALLTAYEKKDSETLALMRATHEGSILALMEDVRKAQVDEANAQIDALTKSRAIAATRYTYYQTLLGVSSPSVPAVGSDIPLLTIPTQPAQNAEGGLPLLQEEQDELDASHSARDWQQSAASIEVIAHELAYMPDVEAAAKPMGAGVGVTWGMHNIIAALTATARQQADQSAQEVYNASHAARMATYFRRQQDWSQQCNLAAGEIMQIDKQLTAAGIRLTIAQQDLAAHEQQIENSNELIDFLSHKYSNDDLYGWIISDVSSTYFQAYQVAYDLAKKAERVFRFERGLTSSNYIQFGYWDSLRSGLQAGERLALALRQLERAYLDQNRRDYEITRHVSLVLHDPMALVALKTTGQCEVDVPESFFDADYPGHYMRRIKSVGITMPCVVGPYTSINCTLTLLANKTRISSIAGSQYMEDVEDGDARFVTSFAAVQSVATSHAQNDNGLFDLNFRDERYLPFEGAGAVSRWRIELPIATNAFDLDTLTDVVLHLRYTSRDGGAILKNAAIAAMNAAIADTDSAPLMRLFSARHEFPNDWYRFLHPTDQTATSQAMTFDLSIERFPYLFRGRSIAPASVDVFLSLADAAVATSYQQEGAPLAVTLTPGSDPSLSPVTLASADNLFGGTPWANVQADLSVPTSLQVTVAEDDVKKIAVGLTEQVPAGGHTRLKADAIDDLVLVVHYTVT